MQRPLGARITAFTASMRRRAANRPDVPHQNAWDHIQRMRRKQKQSFRTVLKYARIIVYKGYPADGRTPVAVLGELRPDDEQLQTLGAGLRLNRSRHLAPIHVAAIRNELAAPPHKPTEFAENYERVVALSRAVPSVGSAVQILQALRTLFIGELRTVISIFPDPPHRRKFQRWPHWRRIQTDWSWRRVLLAAHMYPELPMRRDLLVQLRPSIGAFRCRIHPERHFERVLVNMWMQHDHVTAFAVLFQYIRQYGEAVASHIPDLWKIFCFTRFTNSFSPPVDIFHKFLQHVPRHLHGQAACTLLESHTFATHLLSVERYSKMVSKNAVKSHLNNLAAAQQACEQLAEQLRTDHATHTALITAIVRLHCALRRPDRPSSQRHSENSVDIANGLLLEMLTTCTPRNPTSDLTQLRTACDLLLDATSRGTIPSRPVRMAWIKCMAQHNALEAAVSGLQAYGHPTAEDDWVFVAVLECGRRVGRPNVTAQALQMIEQYQQPKVLLKAMKLRLAGPPSSNTADTTNLLKEQLSTLEAHLNLARPDNVAEENFLKIHKRPDTKPKDARTQKPPVTGGKTQRKRRPRRLIQTS